MSFVPVRTSTLRAGLPLLFDVYIFFEETYLKYRHTRETFEENKLQQFLKKKVKKVFILDSDEPSYLKYLESALDQLQEANVSVGERAEFAVDTIASEAENIEKNLDNEQSYKNTQNRMAKVINFLVNEKDALKTMMATAGISIDADQHGANVCSLSLGMAAQLPWPDPTEVQDLGIAALVHDMGKKKLGIDPLLHRSQISKEDMKKYREHAKMSVEMLSGKRFITPKVLKLIEDHEEIGQGEGFPEKKNIKRLGQSSQILNLCNDFDRYCMHTKKSHSEGYSTYVEERGSFFPLEMVELLGQAIGAPQA